MLQHTYLVQRLKAPLPKAEGMQAHHVFGGLALGLSKEAWEFMDQFCTIDYMGAAEYEFGQMSKVLSDFAIWAGEGKLCSFAFTLGPHERALNWARRSLHWSEKSKPKPPAQVVTIFGICRADLVQEVQDRIRGLAKADGGVKRGTHMSSSLDPIAGVDYRDPIQGWLEMNNIFFFFSNQKMWEKCCELFAVELCSVPDVPAAVDYTKMNKKELVRTALNLGMFINKTAANEVKKAELQKLLSATSQPLEQEI